MELKKKILLVIICFLVIGLGIEVGIILGFGSLSFLNCGAISNGGENITTLENFAYPTNTISENVAYNDATTVMEYPSTEYPSRAKEYMARSRKSKNTTRKSKELTKEAHTLDKMTSTVNDILSKSPIAEHSERSIADMSTVSGISEISTSKSLLRCKASRNRASKMHSSLNSENKGISRPKFFRISSNPLVTRLNAIVSRLAPYLRYNRAIKLATPEIPILMSVSQVLNKYNESQGPVDLTEFVNSEQHPELYIYLSSQNTSSSVITFLRIIATLLKTAIGIEYFDDNEFFSTDVNNHLCDHNIASSFCSKAYFTVPYFLRGYPLVIQTLFIEMRPQYTKIEDDSVKMSLWKQGEESFVRQKGLHAGLLFNEFLDMKDHPMNNMEIDLSNVNWMAKDLKNILAEEYFSDNGALLFSRNYIVTTIELECASKRFEDHIFLGRSGDIWYRFNGRGTVAEQCDNIFEVFGNMGELYSARIVSLSLEMVQ